MIVQYVDTHDLLALVNSTDKDHIAAVERSRGRVGRLITTTWVLVAFADARSAWTAAAAPRNSFADLRQKRLSRSFHPRASSFSEP